MMLIVFSITLIISVELVRTLAKSLNNYLPVTILELSLTFITLAAASYFFYLNFNYVYYFYLLIIQYSIVLMADIIWYRKTLKKVK